MRATCEACHDVVEVDDLFSFDCTCSACGGVLVLDGDDAGADEERLERDEDEADLTAARSADQPAPRDGEDRTRVDPEDDEASLFDRPPQDGPTSLHDRPTKADTEEDPYELAAQALDSSVSRATSRLATSRRTTQAVTAYSEEELFAPDAPTGPAPSARVESTPAAAPSRAAMPLLEGTAPDAPPVPSWDDTGKVVAAEEAGSPDAGLEGLVEVVEVPIGGTAGRGSRTYEREEVLGGGAGARVTEPADGLERGVSGRAGRPAGPLFGDEDLDWLALIDDNLPENDVGDGDGKPRVVIRLPEDAAPTDASDSDRVRQFEQAIKNLEAGGGPGAIDELLQGGPSDTTSRRARRYDGSSTQPITQPTGESTQAIGSSTQPLKRPDEDTRTWDAADQGASGVKRPPSARNEQAKGGDGSRPRGPRSVETFAHDDLDPALVCARDDSSPDADRFRQLVQRIFHPADGPAPRVVMVTSARPGDGKTTVAANLAIAAAGGGRLAGRGAVLVDADPRGRGVLHHFGVRVRNEGLLEALRSESVSSPDPRDFVMQFSLGTLDVVPLGIPGSDAAELLASDRMGVFLGRLRDTYPGAAIIVDASSLLHAADPLVLARGVDGVVLVVRADRTPRDEVRRAIEMLGPRRVLGLVLNDSAA